MSANLACPGEPAAAGADEQAELAKELQNPVAKLISVPVQSNWDFNIGPVRALRYTVNVQPVIPFSLTDDWNLITRTILPIIHAESPVEGAVDGPAQRLRHAAPQDRPAADQLLGRRPLLRRGAVGGTRLGTPVRGDLAVSEEVIRPRR
jgi:hypothetical protein